MPKFKSDPLLSNKHTSKYIPQNHLQFGPPEPSPRRPLIISLGREVDVAAVYRMTYTGRLATIRELYKNRPRAYLDNAAAPLVLSTIAYKAADLLCSQVLVNPHSHGVLATDTQALVASVRHEVLDMLGLSTLDYEVVFTANATAAIKLIGEGDLQDFAYLTDSHTSIMGLRQIAKSYRTFEDIDSLSSTKGQAHDVVAWPLQSNFAGKRYPGRDWAVKVRDSGRLSLLDIASYAATQMPDLGEIEPDFAVLSFYKIFGLPDLGALIVRKDSTLEYWQTKKYFGGGTVAVVTASDDFVVRPTSLADLLEDGTLPVHSILMLRAAICEFLKVYGSFDAISEHTTAVARYARAELEPYAQVLEMGDSPIVTFIPRIGHNEFVSACNLADVHVRGGTLCNIGAFSHAIGWEDGTIIDNHLRLGKRCNDDISFINADPTGVVRASIGPYTSFSDIDALVEVARAVSAPVSRESTISPTTTPFFDVAKVESLIIYPIKSCAGVRLRESTVTEEGLEGDRLFCLVDLATQKVLSLKRHRAMTFIKPCIRGEEMVVQAGEREVTFPLKESRWQKCKTSGELVLCLDAPIIDFFSDVLQLPCTIAKHVVAEEAASFSNSSPLLVVTTASAAELPSDVAVFRPNIVLRTTEPWTEDRWTGLRHKSSVISMLGRCRRCNMVCVTATGGTDNAPYMQLCKKRRIDGKLYFGQHATVHGIATLAVGDSVQPF